ncbi:DUF1127 domain-containing protein [Azospirillum sp. ST 5-10]|uniref:DUF1127 domain-containing protein n=1 Tax=unclassified Azospirillum TaxID=2630922 RepID=UPI003F49F4CE
MRTTMTADTTTRTRTGLARTFGNLVVAAADTLATWNDRRRQRAALQSLPDHLLHDIGVSRADVAHEADKPFWQG